MQSEKFSDIALTLENTITALEEDARFIFDYFHKTGRGGWPIPIYAMQLYTFARIDYLSSLWAGWNDITNRPTSDKRNQTERITDFLEKYLNYGRNESFIALDIWRHKLMHTAEPRILKGAKIYRWLWNYRLPSDQHWQFHPNGNEWILGIGFFNLLHDLKTGVKKYAQELADYQELQTKYENTIAEFDSYQPRI